jgi:tetratricopeptide (TPR) repeat protein
MYNSYVHYFQALNYFQVKNFHKALTCFGDALRLSKKSNSLPSFQNLIKAQIILTEIKSNKSDINLETVPEFIKSNQLSVYETSLYRSYSKILLSLEKGNFSAIEKWIFKAIEIDKNNRNIWNLAMDHIILSEVFQEKRQPSKALENLKISKSFFKENGANGWCDHVKVKIASL